MREKKNKKYGFFYFFIHCAGLKYTFFTTDSFIKLKMMILFMILKQTWMQSSLFFHCSCLGSVLASRADWSVILLCFIIKAFIFMALFVVLWEEVQV